METTTIEINGALSLNVKTNKDPLARQTRTEVKHMIVEAGGKLVRFDVFQGAIFVNTDKDEAAKVVIDRFSKYNGVEAKKIDTLQAILRKSQLMPAPQVDKKQAV